MELNIKFILFFIFCPPFLLPVFNSVEKKKDWMCEIIESIRIGKTGKAFVVDSEGTIIAHPDLELVVNKKKINNNDIKNTTGKIGNFF